jgi:hypothetical protein
VPSRLKTHAVEIGVALAVASLCLYAFVVRARFLLASPYPLGVDGYYYPIQLRSLLEEGRLAYPSAPLVLWLLAPLAALTDPIVGAKLGAALGTALAPLPAYLLAKRISGARAPALLGAALVATSAQSFYLSTEFVKEGVGLTLALAFLAALGRALGHPTRARWLGALGLFLASVLSHKTALGLALIGGVPALLAWVSPSGLRRGLLVALGALVLVVALGLLAPRRFVGVRDLLLVTEMFQSQADLSLPVLATPTLTLVFAREVTLAALLAALLVASYALPYLLRHRANATPSRDRLPALGVGLVAYALFCGLPWLDVSDEQGLAFRLRLSTFVTLAPLSALLAVRVLRAAPPLGRWLLPLAVAVGLVVGKPAASREGVVATHPALATAASALSLPPGSLVVTPERKVAFMATWYARVPARLRPPADLDPTRTFRLLPGASIDDDLRRALDDLRARPRDGVEGVRDLHPHGPNGLVVLSEPTFQYLLTELPPWARARYVRWPVR